MQIAGFARYIRYAIFVGRNIEIVFKRSRQGLLRFETVAFRQVQDWLIALLELFAQSPSAYGCGCTGRGNGRSLS